MAATPNSYLTVAGLSGVSGTANVPASGKIEILEFSFSVSHVGSQPPGQPRSVEAVVRTPMTVKKKVDKVSPKLFKACCRAEIFSEAILHVFSANENNPFIKYKMVGVHISKYETSSADQIPEETLELTFDQLGVGFIPAGIGTVEQGNSSHNESTPIAEVWNWIMEVPGFSWMPTGNI